MNRRGQEIAFGLLIVLALALSLTAGFAMAGVKNNIQSQSSDVAALTSDLEFNEGYILAQAKLFGKQLVLECLSCSEQRLKTTGQEFEAQHNLKLPGSGNFFAKLRNGNFTLTEKNSLHILEIQDLFVQSEIGANKIVRNFNICFEFDSEGNFVKDC